MAGHCPGTGAQGHDAFEILGLILLVRHLSAVAIQLVLAGPPAGGIYGSDDAVHAVRGQKAILDALAQAVGVDRVAKVFVAVAGFLA